MPLFLLGFLPKGSQQLACQLLNCLFATDIKGINYLFIKILLLLFLIALGFNLTTLHIGKTIWMDSGFAERFLFTTVRPFRYFYCTTLPKYLAEIIAGNIHLHNTFPKYSGKVI